MQTIYY